MKKFNYFMSSSIFGNYFNNIINLGMKNGNKRASFLTLLTVKPLKNGSIYRCFWVYVKNFV